MNIQDLKKQADEEMDYQEKLCTMRNEEIVLADYKTDKVSTKEELIARYKNQLDYYQQALEQITGKRVKERYLYSFSLQEEIYV